VIAPNLYAADKNAKAAAQKKAANYLFFYFIFYLLYTLLFDHFIYFDINIV